MLGTVALLRNRISVIFDTGASENLASHAYWRFLPGDRVCKEGTEYALMSRIKQTHVAVVRSTHPTSLYFPQCSTFTPHVRLDTLEIGDRLAIVCEADGGFTLLQNYGKGPEGEAACLLRVYEATESRAAPLVATGTALYTRSDVVDHTDLDTFTVDPATSVDFDDAISVVRNTVYVHIVDIAAATDTSLTEAEEARLRSRCQTLYLANEATCHLLDPDTAGNRLSLIVGEPRPVITVAMVTNPDNGSIVSSEIYRSTIVVKRRYVYEDVAAMFLSGTPTEAMAYLHHLTELRSSVLNYRLALPSLRFRVDLSGVVTSVVSEDTNDAAHSLVATAMIMANLVVSLLLKENGIPNRFHASPLRGIPPVATTTGNRAVDSYLRVKRYARASYDVDERGHFGLGLTDYVHFTSPMRRYADVVIHRILSGVFYVDLDAEVTAMNRSVSRDLQEIYQSWKIVRHLSSLSSHASHVVYVVGIKERGGVYWFMPSLSLDGFTHLSRMMPPQFWGSSDSELVGARVTVRMGDAFYATVESIDSVTCRVMLQIHTDRPAP